MARWQGALEACVQSAAAVFPVYSNKSRGPFSSAFLNTRTRGRACKYFKVPNSAGTLAVPKESRSCRCPPRLHPLAIASVAGGPSRRFFLARAPTTTPYLSLADRTIFSAIQHDLASPPAISCALLLIRSHDPRRISSLFPRGRSILSIEGSHRPSPTRDKKIR